MLSYYLFIYLGTNREIHCEEKAKQPQHGERNKCVLSNFYYEHIQSPISLVHISFEIKFALGYYYIENSEGNYVPLSTTQICQEEHNQIGHVSVLIYAG